MGTVWCYFVLYNGYIVFILIRYFTVPHFVGFSTLFARSVHVEYL